MLNLSDHYQYLFLGKVTRTLDPSEASELDTLLENNAEIKKAYEEFTETLPSNYVANSFNHLNKTDYWKDISEKYERSKLIIMWRRLSISAAIAALIAGGWYLLRPQNENMIARYNHLRKKESVELKLANGKLLDLSNNKGRINEGSTDMINSENSLIYSSNNMEDYSINTINIPAGMDYKITLSDGSKVWMNSMTHLDFPTNFSSTSREISINGEAYIEVAQDPKRPFTVKLPGAEVHVLGTAFNVNTYDESVIKAALVNGSIEFSGGQIKLIIKPGKQAIYNTNGNLSSQSFDERTVLGWKKGLFYFEDANLNNIAKVIERWFGIKSVVDNKELLDIKIAGVLNKNKPLENFLDDLKAIAKIKSHFDENGILHF